MVAEADLRFNFVRFVTCLSAVFIGTFDEQMFLVSKVVELI